MQLHQQVDEDGDEDGAGQDVRADDVEGEVGQQDQGQPLGDGEAVGDLRVDLRVGVVWLVEFGERGESV